MRSRVIAPRSITRSVPQDIQSAVNCLDCALIRSFDLASASLACSKAEDIEAASEGDNVTPDKPTDGEGEAKASDPHKTRDKRQVDFRHMAPPTF
jgi:hypothetical protein